MYRPINDALAAVPGIQARGFVSALAFTSSVGWGSINVENWTPQPGQELQVDRRGATIDYFRAMKIPLTQGRFFEESDLPGAGRAGGDHRSELRRPVLARGAIGSRSGSIQNRSSRL